MTIDLRKLTEHDLSDECPVCRTQQMVRAALLPDCDRDTQMAGLLASRGARQLHVVGTICPDRRSGRARTLLSIEDVARAGFGA